MNAARRTAVWVLCWLIAFPAHATYTVAAAPAAPVVTHEEPAAAADPPAECDIVCENAKPGTTAWDLPDPDEGDHGLQGFATDISVNRGDTVHFKIDTNAPAYTIQIFRLGYYQGLGGRAI